MTFTNASHWSPTPSLLRVAWARKRKAVVDTIVATINFKREAELQKKIATISQSEFEQAQQQVESADAALDNAKAEISGR